MGCGASSENNDNEERRERRERKEKDGKSSERRRSTKDGKAYEKTDEAADKEPAPRKAAVAETKETAKSDQPEGDAAAAAAGGDGQVLTAAVMQDLRVKSKEMGGGTVQRWADAIADPGENDAADVYDPVRRHGLAMESLAARFASAP